MKKIITLFLGTILIISSCNDKNDDFSVEPEFNIIISKYNNINNATCTSVEDAINFPEPWTKEVSDTFRISEDKLKNTSTCGLIQTFSNQPWKILGPWCSTCSDLKINGVQYFNDRIEQNVVLRELFSREDALEKLIGRYVSNIQNLKSLEAHPGYLHSYEILLASESMNNIITNNVEDELLILALRMIELKKENPEFKNENSIAITRHILANILFQKQFEPFLSACLINGFLATNLYGYNICYEGEKVENYAKMYLRN